MFGTPWRPDEDVFIVKTNSTLSAREQAARLQRSYGATVERRHGLIRAGLLDKTERKVYRPWTDDQEQELMSLLREGYTLKQIARRIDRTYNSVVVRCTLLGGADWIRRPKDGMQVRTIMEAVNLFGVYDRTVRYWLQQGWIEGKRDSQRRGCLTLIADTSLLTVLSRRESWVTWQPETITDTVWREQAIWERQRVHGHWLTLDGAARRAGCHHKTIWRAVSTGIVPGQRYGRYCYVWSTDLDRWIRGEQ